MNRKRWLLVAILVGCGAGVATMTVVVPAKSIDSTANGLAKITIDGLGSSERFGHDHINQQTGQYVYVVPALTFEEVPSGTYTGTVSVDFSGFDAVIGTCTVVVDAPNQECTTSWEDEI